MGVVIVLTYKHRAIVKINLYYTVLNLMHFFIKGTQLMVEAMKNNLNNNCNPISASFPLTAAILHVFHAPSLKRLLWGASPRLNAMLLLSWACE